MAEVVVELIGQPWTGGGIWTRSVTVSAPEDATKVAEWLKTMLPELIAHAKSGYSARVEVSVKD